MGGLWLIMSGALILLSAGALPDVALAQRASAKMGNHRIPAENEAIVRTVEASRGLGLFSTRLKRFQKAREKDGISYKTVEIKITKATNDSVTVLLSRTISETTIGNGSMSTAKAIEVTFSRRGMSAHSYLSSTEKAAVRNYSGSRSRKREELFCKAIAAVCRKRSLLLAKRGSQGENWNEFGVNIQTPPARKQQKLVMVVWEDFIPYGPDRFRMYKVYKDLSVEYAPP